MILDGSSSSGSVVADHLFNVFPIVYEGSVLVFVLVLLCVLSSFATILKSLKSKIELVALLLLSYGCLVPIMFSGSSSRCPRWVCSV